jgi:Ca2+-binding EF-hand superfamily protein
MINILSTQRLLVSAAVLLVPALSALRAEDGSKDLFARLDHDANGVIVSDEIDPDSAALFEHLLRKADKNGDGQLTGEEFQTGLSHERPAKPLTAKLEESIPGGDALLLLLVWMDANGDLTIVPEEVPADLRVIYDRLVQAMPNSSGPIRIRQLEQASPQLARQALLYTRQKGIDVAAELELLTDRQRTVLSKLQNPMRPGEGLSKRENALALFEQLDTDGDGLVALGEIPEPLAERLGPLLKRADRDGDKRISKSELEAASRQMAALQANQPSPAEVKQRVKQLLRRFDRDASGKLSRDELPPFLANLLQRVDADENGELDSDELSKGVALGAAVRRAKPQTDGSRQGSGD